MAGMCTWLPWTIYGAVAILLFGMFVHIVVHCRKCGGGWFAVSTGIGILALFELFHCGEVIPVAFAGLGMAVFLGIGVALPGGKDTPHSRSAQRYFRQAIKADYALDDARQALLNEGWPEHMVEDVARRFRKVSTPRAAQAAEQKVLRDIEYQLVQGLAKGLTLDDAAKTLVKAGWPQALVHKQLAIQRGDVPSETYSISPADAAPHTHRAHGAALPRKLENDQDETDDPLPTPRGKDWVDPNWG